MIPLIDEPTELNHQAFILTPKMLEKFEKLRLQDPAAFDQAVQLLIGAQTNVFIPFLTRTSSLLLEFEFERFAYEYLSYRLTVLGLLLKAFGASDFGVRYVSALSKLSNILSDRASKWELDPQQLQELIFRYLTSAIRMLRIASTSLEPIDQPKLIEILKAITMVDFGLTAIVLVFEDSITPEKSLIKKTFDLTSKALDDYTEAVSSLFKDKKHQGTVAGSLSVEGDLDQALSNFSSALQSPSRR